MAAQQTPSCTAVRGALCPAAKLGALDKGLCALHERRRFNTPRAVMAAADTPANRQHADHSGTQSHGDIGREVAASRQKGNGSDHVTLRRDCGIKSRLGVFIHSFIHLSVGYSLSNCLYQDIYVASRKAVLCMSTSDGYARYCAYMPVLLTADMRQYACDRPSFASYNGPHCFSQPQRWDFSL